MKIIIHLSNKQYEKAVKRFLNYKWHLKELIEFKEEIKQIDQDEIVLTDEAQLFNRFKNNAFLLSEKHDPAQRKIGKYMKFDHVIRSISPTLSTSLLNNKKVKLITISSVQGGVGKTSVLRHLAYHLSNIYQVSVFHLFGASKKACDLSDFILEYKNTKKFSKDYFYVEDECKYMMNGFSNLKDVDSVDPEELYKALMHYLSSKSIDIVLFELPHLSINICKYFIKMADYHFIVKDCRRTTDLESRLYLNYMNSDTDMVFQGVSNRIVIQNFSQENGIFDLPIDRTLYKQSGEVNENSLFYNKIKRIMQGAIDV